MLIPTALLGRLNLLSSLDVLSDNKSFILIIIGCALVDVNNLFEVLLLRSSKLTFSIFSDLSSGIVLYFSRIKLTVLKGLISSI